MSKMMISMITSSKIMSRNNRIALKVMCTFCSQGNILEVIFQLARGFGVKLIEEV